MEATPKIWTCKIGEVEPSLLPDGADHPMRVAVCSAYELLTGQEPEFLFSGWGGSLTEAERAVVEERMPRPDPYRELQEAAEAAEETLTRQGYSENDIDTRGGAALMALRAALASVKGGQ